MPIYFVCNVLIVEKIKDREEKSKNEVYLVVEDESEIKILNIFNMSERYKKKELLKSVKEQEESHKRRIPYSNSWFSVWLNNYNRL